MGSIVVNGTTIPDYSGAVTVDGTTIEDVYFNGTKYWTRNPYPPGTDVFSFTWYPGSTLFAINSYVSAYPLVFASPAPYIYSGNGSGYPDAQMRVTLNTGFHVVNVSNAERGYYGTVSTDGLLNIGVYNTFTCCSGNVTGFCGNGQTSFTIRYVGY